MSKLAQEILSELFRQIIGQAVMPAYCRERRPLTWQGRSWQVAVTAKLQNQSSSRAQLQAAPVALGCSPQPHHVLCSCVLLCSTSLLCFQGQQFLVFVHCLSEMFKELVPVDSPPKRTNLQKTKTQNFCGEGSGKQ